MTRASDVLAGRAVDDPFPAVVIGAGISGLACAYALRKAGVDAQVFEASGRAGGLIESTRLDGFLLELGPQSFTATEALQQLCRELEIESRAVEAPPRAPRFILLDGALKAAPLSPLAFLASSFVGIRTKWSLARDLFGKSSPPAAEESVAAFLRRKFSAELLENLVGPFVSGIYAGDPEKLSLQAAFPELYRAEVSAGSVLRGVIRAAKNRRQPSGGRTPRSFEEGNETLTRALAGKLGDRLHLETPVTALGWASATEEVYTVRASVGGASRTFTARHVVLALPSLAASALLREVAPDLSRALEEIDYAPVAVVALAYREAAVGRGLQGFGFLVPRSAGLETLGSVWNSSLFPGRAPQGCVLMTSFVGGALNPRAAAFGTEELAELVHRELEPVLQLRERPAFSRVTAHPRAIPQYNLGHRARLEALEKAAERFPGLSMTGNYLRGPSIGACVEQAQAVAATVAARLKS